MDINEFKDRDNKEYVFSKQAMRQTMMRVISQMPREEIEKDLLRYLFTVEDAKCFIYFHEEIKGKDRQELTDILNFKEG